MFDFDSLIRLDPTEKPPSVGEPVIPAPDEVLPVPEPPAELPPGMILVNNELLSTPPYYRRDTVSRRCRWIESQQNQVIETFGNCVTVLAALECRAETKLEVSWTLDGPWFVLKTTIDYEHSLRMLTICDGQITENEDPPEEWEPEEEAWEPEVQAAAEREAEEAASNGTENPPTTSEADAPTGSSSTDPDAPPPNETPEQRDQRLRDKTAKRAAGRFRPGDQPAGVGSPPPPPVIGPDGTPLWKPDTVIADVFHGFSERTDTVDDIVLVWHVWIAIDVYRSGCLWIAIYHAYAITFRTSRATGALTRSVEPEPRPPTTRTQVIPGCKESAVSLRADTFPRATGGIVGVAGHFREALAEPVALIVKNREGLVLAREETVSGNDGRFEIAFDVETALPPEGEELVLEALARDGTLRSVTKVRLVPPTIVGPQPILIKKLLPHG